MLSELLSVTGRPGLYKLISTNKNMNIVESLIDGKRIPVYVQEKAIALSDVSIITDEGDTPLREVLKKIKEKEEGKPVSMGTKSSNKELFSFLEEVLPNYSKERVYAGDVKKLISWYNILVENNIDLEEVSKTEEDHSSNSETKEEGASATDQETKEIE